ncbi:MAG: RNA degradosome polyphosphate kinase [Lachnospiraceae bacterium]|nr:RNA degradosome polyphosphate kinase [Lachnospiraceae bacterium]MDD3614628.1 RNA degradosome polyphosphate kinase [Lachnospiraceae bacterium]
MDDYKSTEYYRNRELSWLSFDERILEEARDKTIPLFERLKFLSITSSNLDEFFMIRVASLKDQVHAGYTKPDIAGLTPKEQLRQLSTRTQELVQGQYTTYNRSLIPSLEKIGLHVVTKHEHLDVDQSQFIDRYFEENIYPVLTPMAMDSARPFPLIRNKTLNIGALISKKENTDGEHTRGLIRREEGRKGKKTLEFATVQVPSVLPRIVRLPDREGKKVVILLEEIIERNIERLFLSYDVVCAYPYRIMRNADLSIDEDEAEDLLKEIQKQLKMRQWGEVIRLEVDEKIDKRLLKILKEEFAIKDEDIFKINGPLDLTFLMKMYGMEGFDEYKTPKYIPAPVPALQTGEDIFTQIRRQDVLLHHPYTSFEPVVSFVKQAAKDPDVLAIKQTLYRVSGDSPIIAALAQAAENGKQVTVLVELKARFDEENNIVWAKMLEKAGCHVIYGLLGLKTHSKITLVVRREEEGIRRYVHLGTGNYNDSTAKLYTDTGLLTCDARIGEDATAVFNMLSGYSEPDHWNKLIVAPIWMKDYFLHLIKMEEEHAKKGQKAHIIAKMNSLCDPVIIAALYSASAAGVKIDLIIRGICSLKVGIPGISENITVRSIVGNFLEHARIFYFYSNGKEEVYMGSADWMPRNLDKRVEIVFPVENEKLKQEVIHILDIQMQDTLKAHILQPGGTYEKIDKRGKVLLCAQDYFCKEAQERVKKTAEAGNSRVFTPAEPLE